MLEEKNDNLSELENETDGNLAIESQEEIQAVVEEEIAIHSLIAPDGYRVSRCGLVGNNTNRRLANRYRFHWQTNKYLRDSWDCDAKAVGGHDSWYADILS